jgi:hypothetical protein
MENENASSLKSGGEHKHEFPMRYNYATPILVLQAMACFKAAGMKNVNIIPPDDACHSSYRLCANTDLGTRTRGATSEDVC